MMRGFLMPARSPCSLRYRQPEKGGIPFRAVYAGQERISRLASGDKKP